MSLVGTQVVAMSGSGGISISLLMLWLFSSEAQKCKDFRISFKPCHVGTHWIALDEYSHMSTHLPGFR